MKIGFVLGTRPEVLKLGLVFNEIERLSPGISTIIDTQQQTTLKNMALIDLKLKSHIVIKHNLDFNLTQNLSYMQVELDKILDNSGFQCLIVQGDTLSAFAGAIAAFYKKIPVIHIEAGLRSNCLNHPFPEEAHRRMLSSITELHFAPNSQAELQLQSEGINKDKIILAGNPLLDIEYHNTDKTKDIDIIITLHRRENHTKAQSILQEIVKTAYKFPHYKFLIIKHTHPNIVLAIDKISKHAPENIVISDALSHPVFIKHLRKCRLVLTDSGGVQEEAAYWNIPTIILRKVSDRPDGIKLGLTSVLGNDLKNMNKLITKQLISIPEAHSAPIQNNASTLIAKHIIKFIQNK